MVTAVLPFASGDSVTNLVYHPGRKPQGNTVLCCVGCPALNLDSRNEQGYQRHILDMLALFTLKVSNGNTPTLLYVRKEGSLVVCKTGRWDVAGRWDMANAFVTQWAPASAWWSVPSISPKNESKVRTDTFSFALQNAARQQKVASRTCLIRSV